MFKVSKATVVLMVIALLALVVSGCTVAVPAAQPAQTTGGETAAQAEQPAGETKEITLWHIQTTTPEVVDKPVERFMADNPDVKVEVVALQNDPFKTKLKVAMGAGNPPCIFPSWGGGPLYEYVTSDQIVDLTEMMNQDNYKDRFVDAALSVVTFDDKIWGVPVENTAVAVVFYNKQIFEEHGLTPPATYDELLNIVSTLKEAGIAPFALANKTKWTGSMYYMYLVDRLGGPDVFRKAATRTGGSFEDPIFIKAGEMLQELVNAGAFSEGYNGLDYDTGQSRALMYSGKAAMEVMGSWNISTVKGENPEFYESSLGFFPFPAIADGAGDPNNVVGTVGDNFYSVSTACPYPEEAFQVIQYLIDDQAVTERAAAGRVPPVKGFTTDDPMLQGIIDAVGKASSVQLWYDQYLPPELGELHKDTSQALLGLTMTPEEAAKAMEDGAKKYFKEE